MGILSKIIWFSSKVGIGAAAVCFTIDQGIWKDSKKSEQIFKTVNDNVPQIKAFKEEFIADYIPNIDTSNIDAKQYWNSAVLKTFSFVADSPVIAAEAGKTLYEKVSSMLEDSPKVTALKEIEKVSSMLEDSPKVTALKEIEK